MTSNQYQTSTSITIDEQLFYVFFLTLPSSDKVYIENMWNF